MNPYSQPFDVLLANGPHPDLAEKLHLFGQFVGSSDLDVVYHGPDGSRALSAEWYFAWALNGCAIQDVWIAPSRRDRARGDPAAEWGTTVRFYDARIDAWRSTWIGPGKGVVLPIVARPVGDEIVLEGCFGEGTRTRWIFSEIRPTSFSWRAVESDDDGEAWTLRQERWARHT